LIGADAFTGQGPDETFRQNLRAGKFVIQRCEECSTHLFYPRSLCTRCGGYRLELVEADGRAVVYATTVNRRRPDAGGPVNVALVDLIEGPRLMTRIEGIAPDDVRIGMKVRARISAAPGGPVLVFQPDEAA
jgi:hypothetical protein